MKVALFITCLTDTFYPRTGIAVVKVLEHLGCEVDFPAEQTCCGQPLFNNGFHEDTKAVAKRMFEAFKDAQYVVTPSGSCAAMIREQYEELFKGDHAYEHAVHDLAGKTYEFVEFLLKVLKVDFSKLDLRWDGKVTYHYSCHLRGLGMKDEAVKVMQQIPGLEYVPAEKVEQCCGFGGTFAMNYPQISGAMVRDKVECLRATQAPVVVSNDAGCTMNISGACRREHCEVGFKSLAEILAEGLGLMPMEEITPVTG